MSESKSHLASAKVSLNKRPELPLIWILPIIALLVSGWLVYKSILEKGPTITIRFATAEGLEIDKTKIKFLNVEIGRVTNITIDNDLKTILVTAAIKRGSENLLHEQTTFWVVRPQIGLAGVSGLGTLLSGAYIETKPGDGQDRRHFVGLEAPPVVRFTQEGRYYHIETNELGSLRAGTSIHFHGIHVGEVTGYTLIPESGLIQLSVFINAPYDRFVRKNTRFWNDGGIDFTANAEGIKVRTSPLSALLTGGIAFEASNDDDISQVAPENSVFTLYKDYAQTTQNTYKDTLRYVMYFNGSVRGLTEGAPVQVRGITIGIVRSINLEVDDQSSAIRIPVVVDISLDRIKEMSKDIVNDDQALIAALVNKGLRAQLQTGSLITGQLLIDLDFYPDSKPREIIKTGKYPEFPTIASSLEQFSNSAKVIMNKLSKLPLYELTTELNKTLQSLQKTSIAATQMLNASKTTLNTADKTISTAAKTLTTADQALVAAQQTLNTFKPGSDSQYQLQQMLQELTQAASSIRQMADILEQQPEALIRGKQQP